MAAALRSRDSAAPSRSDVDLMQSNKTNIQHLLYLLPTYLLLYYLFLYLSIYLCYSYPMY